MNADKLIEFLAALIKDAKKKVFLVLDNLRVLYSTPVKARLEEKKAQIEPRLKLQTTCELSTF